MAFFSSSKQSESPARSLSSTPEPVRRADLTAVPVGSGWHAVNVRGAAETNLWPSFAVDFLAGCSDFKPLAEHLTEYGQYHSLEPAQVREISHWAEQMIAAGAIIGASRLVERCVAAGTGHDEIAHIDSAGIPTAGNEARIRRIITTFARNARAYGRTIEFTFSANGPDGNAAATAELVAALGKSESVKATLLNDESRRRIAADLAQRAGIDPYIATFAIQDPLETGFACGANRNAMLLRNSGRPYLSLDDDVACEMAAAPRSPRKDGLTVFSSRDAFERWFFPDYSQVFEKRRSVECDYFGLHEQMLGRSVSAFLGRCQSPDFIGISDDLLRRLQETDGRIVATFTGHYGHPGVPTSYYYLTYRAETLARLTGEGEEQYRAYLASGSVCALVPHMAIADASLSPGMAIGIDARKLIPPFPPVLHAEDFVWGAALWQCCATGFAGHLPVALRHDPGVGRGIIAPPLAGHRPVAIWEFAHILRGLVLGWNAAPGMLDTAARMESLGRNLGGIAGSSAGEFHEYLRSFVLQHESDKIAYMEQLLAEEDDAPDFWRNDVEAYIEQTRLALAEPDFDIPFDMRKWPPAEGRALMQRLVLEYGRLLGAWPALTAAAREVEWT